MRWRSNRCKKHCLPTEIEVTGITIEELLLEDPSYVFQVGSAIYHDEAGDDVSLHLPTPYRDWADVFS